MNYEQTNHFHLKEPQPCLKNCVGKEDVCKIWKKFGEKSRLVKREICLSFPLKYSVHFEVGLLSHAQVVSVILIFTIYSASLDAALLVAIFSIVNNSQTIIRNTGRELPILLLLSHAF